MLYQQELSAESGAKVSLKCWLITFAIVVILVVISYEWLDLPIAMWFHQNPLPKSITAIFTPLGKVYDPLVLLAYVGLFFVGLLALARRSFTKPMAVTLAATLSIIITDACKVLLKYIFGRSSPGLLFVGSYPDQLVYGFNWFYGEPGSFPSGHMAAVCALLAVLWRCYPRDRPLYILSALTVGAILITMDVHFLSDIIGGTFLGASLGWWIGQLIHKRLKAYA